MATSRNRLPDGRRVLGEFHDQGDPAFEMKAGVGCEFVRVEGDPAYYLVATQSKASEGGIQS